MKQILFAFCLFQAASLVSSENGDSSLHILLRTLDSEEIEELVEVLLEGNAAQKKEENNAQDRLNFESRKRELMADSAALTEQVLEAERMAVANGRQSEVGRRLKGYVDSTAYVQSISRLAERQLNMINSFKREWDEVYGANGNDDAFWAEVRRSRLFEKNTCTLEDAEAGMCLQDRAIIDTCPLESDPNCNKHINGRTIYRTFDGSCTNLEAGQRWWGQAMTAQARVLEPAYENNSVGEVRVTGNSTNALPNARNVSRVLNNRPFHRAAIFSYFMMQFGQFLDHDITHTDLMMVQNDDGTTSDVECACDMEINATSSCMIVHYQESDDPQVQSVGRECMTMVRSAAWPLQDCQLGKREQLNSVTAFIDCSQVYGSSKSDANKLRDNSDLSRGKMDMMDHPYNSTWKSLLPTLGNKEHKKTCHSDTLFDNNTVEYACFLAGDSRRNVQPGLSAFHTLWVRFHNYIEEELHTQNPGWNGETLFQEARRMVIAITQHITYNEYLRLLIGNDFRDEIPEYGASLEVDPTLTAHVNVYNSSVNPSIVNVFSTAGYRFGHSEINKYVRFLSQFQGDPISEGCRGDPISDDPRPDHCVEIRELWNNPTTIYKSPAGDNVPGIDAIVLGILEEPAERVDIWYTEEITEYLFTEDPSDDLTFGFDLFALNIQRGRDHGLPGYMDFRQHYGLETTNSWDPRPNWFNVNEWRKLSNVYPTPWDIDVYPGGLLERHTAGAETGELFKIMMADQFLRLKIGDRFWYEQGDEDWSFTEDQLNEIRKMTMSGLLCATLDFPGEIPKFAFNVFNGANPLLNCAEGEGSGSTEETHPRIDFSKFQDATKNP